MAEREEITIPVADRTGWGAGPWDDEPDYETWRTAVGYPAIARRVGRNFAGHWCGYVAVPPGHPWHKQGYDDIRTAEGEWPDVHGGLTYAEFCNPKAGVCHVPAPGEPEDVWWLGFDCAHSADFRPGDGVYWRSHGHPEWARPEFGETYKTLAYVKAECERLAQQARVCEAGS